MSIIYNFEDIKKLQFTINDALNICAKTISEVLNENKIYNLNYVTKKLVHNLIVFDFKEDEIIYNVKSDFSLTSHEIILYVILTYYDLKEVSVQKFISQFKEEIMRYSIYAAMQRLEYLKSNNKI